MGRIWKRYKPGAKLLCKSSTESFTITRSLLKGDRTNDRTGLVLGLASLGRLRPEGTRVDSIGVGREVQCV